MAIDLHAVRDAPPCARIQVTSRSEWRVGIESSGELDCAVADQRDALLTAELAARRQLLRVDVERVGFMDCSIVGVLAAADARCREECADLLLVGVRPPMARLLDLCELDEVLLVNGDRLDRDTDRDGERRLARPGPA